MASAMTRTGLMHRKALLPLYYVPSCSIMRGEKKPPIEPCAYNNPYIKIFQRKRIVDPEFYKQTTGLTGLPVKTHPHRDLTAVYGRILRALTKFPADVPYRKYTEQIVKERLNIVETEPNIEKLEEKIGMGQIEEVIQQAEYELTCARQMFEAKVWEELVEPAPVDQWKWPV